MKRTLLYTMFLAIFGMALAGPPVDVQLMCGEGDDATLVGVASLVEDQLHVALIDGALEACTAGVYGVADGATVFLVSYNLLDGVLTEVQVLYDEDPTYMPTVTYVEVPAVAVEGKLGAQQNREMARELAARAQERADEARERADEARERADEARERAAEQAGGPPMDVPGRGGDDEGEQEEQEEQEEEEEDEEDEDEDDGDGKRGPPAHVPARPNPPGRP